MSDDESRGHTDVELLVSSEFLCDEFARGFRDRLETFNEESCDAWDEFHDSTHLDTESEGCRDVVDEFLSVLASEASDDNTDDDTEEERFSEESELLLHSLCIDVELIEAWNAVEHLTNADGDRREALTERLWDGYAFHAWIEFLELLGGHVGKDEGDDIADDGGEETPHDAVGEEIDYGTDECEMPVVPQVDVHRACEASEQQQEVDTEANWDDECAHGGVVSHGCGCRPSHVEDVKLEVVDFNHLSECRSEA